LWCTAAATSLRLVPTYFFKSLGESNWSLRSIIFCKTNSPANSPVFEVISARLNAKNKPLGPVITGEYVHPNVLYSMEIDAKVRRLVVGAALGNAG
jgi:hypothetical protein